MTPSEQTFKFRATGHTAEAFMRAHRDRTKVPVCFSLPDGDVILYGVVVAFEPATEDEPFSEIEFSLITP